MHKMLVTMYRRKKVLTNWVATVHGPGVDAGVVEDVAEGKDSSCFYLRTN
jgi:hypothetical protein